MLCSFLWNEKKSGFFWVGQLLILGGSFLCRLAVCLRFLFKIIKKNTLRVSSSPIEIVWRLYLLAINIKEVLLHDTSVICNILHNNSSFTGYYYFVSLKLYLCVTSHHLCVCVSVDVWGCLWVYFGFMWVSVL